MASNSGTGWRGMSDREKKAFYALASKKELLDIYAKARFNREPWYMTVKKIEKERSEKNGQNNSATDECSGV